MIWAAALISRVPRSIIVAFITAIGVMALLWLYIDAVQDRAELRRQIKALELSARADEEAANKRRIDAETVTQAEKELHSAIAQTPDSSPDAVRIKLGCERLSRQGSDISALPACRGSGD